MIMMCLQDSAGQGRGVKLTSESHTTSKRSTGILHYEVIRSLNAPKRSTGILHYEVIRSLNAPKRSTGILHYEVIRSLNTPREVQGYFIMR